MSGRQGTVITTILNSMASKESDYRQGVKKNHQLSSAVAERLAKDGPLEEVLLALNDDDEEILPPKEIQSFLQEQQQRLKTLAEQNTVQDERIGYFLGALNQLKQDFAQKENDNGNIHDENADYASSMKQFMKEQEEQHNADRDIQQSTFCTEIRAALGEDDPNAGGEDDDDDIAVVRNNEETAASYKCCVTGMWMEDPVTSTKCNHSYSRQGIYSVIQSSGGRQCDCPFVGCNQKITKNDLEDDAGMARKVNRMRRRVEDEELRKKQSQAMDMIDDDEEEEEG